MEGILYKWTNYWNGWQPRWFVLDQGVLAYYKSQEEVNQGSKGSVKLSACEIVVHPTDTMRIDIVIPYEQHFYLKAPSPHERHAWLVALGSAKAGIPPAIPQAKVEKGTLLSEPERDTVKVKKSELRLTCDLLMKQVYSVKTAANNPDGPDLEKLDESTALLTATCDTFIRTLEECMKLANTSPTPQLSGDPPVPPITLLKERKSSSSTPVVTRQNSAERRTE
ncbi:pleckstrin homology domain-containing family A member 3-like isoform X1 [Penaeus japonicus]|uniref:pleckstrin homology domain-containing family A member 3-like isoform X1 n=1 Tax=Penaeus japonicus TaxID=27405 RepID=UPI001C715197|nr:pleckstrin homology domain-containing family A member 3-like isoform X1 [Penaeus japonicus]